MTYLPWERYHPQGTEPFASNNNKGHADVSNPTVEIPFSVDSKLYTVKVMLTRTLVLGVLCSNVNINLLEEDVMWYMKYHEEKYCR